METLFTSACPLIFKSQRTAKKTVVSCHHKVQKQRPSLELHSVRHTAQRQDKGTLPFSGEELGRRQMLMFPMVFEVFMQSLKDNTAKAADFADMAALRGKDYGKTKMRYPDYVETESGLQYKDLRIGSGPIPKIGDAVVVDWDGYTIGYYGRIFEARNKSKGGSFEGNDKDYFKFQLGSKQVIPAFEEAVASMSVGGVRRVIVPPELGYPDYNYNNAGPKPTTFSGQRALDFIGVSFLLREEIHLRVIW
ncbi:hypothetical protein SUGI_0937460 [Cryptomeria japonica]|nr:hypothetical protein SUGI_0937460 [Cryptomeria japonica]